MQINCFKAYDVRGRMPDELNEDIVYRIGRGYAQFLQPSNVVVGWDIRLSSPAMSQALIKGLTESGVNVTDIGLCGTEEVYFATFSQGFDGGIMITASHNPKDYNGIKFVREDSKPISGDTGLQDIRRFAESGDFETSANPGAVRNASFRDEFVQHLLGYVNVDALKPLKLVVNAGNGGGGVVIDALEKHLPFEFIKINHEPDGNFPNGIPNPLLTDNRSATADAVIQHGADMGIAWDGDFDRCFLFDENGGFIEGYYIVGLLAQAFLSKEAGGRIIYDPRLVWNTQQMVEQAGGVPVMSKAGHAFIKETMRKENAIYGGEMSAHHYFRDFAYCDSGMIPWLLVSELLSRQNTSLSAMVGERMAAYPASGEINRKIDDPPGALAAAEARFADQANKIERVDGLGMEFDDWRFNLRPSNTEPVVRLNVESRGDPVLMQQMTDVLVKMLES
ncbi:MAG: phosphomannomutase [Pseudomonadota bacterium]